MPKSDKVKVKCAACGDTFMDYGFCDLCEDCNYDFSQWESGEVSFEKTHSDVKKYIKKHYSNYPGVS